MNYTLLFFLCASAILTLSTVTICVAPIINGFLSINGNNNCQLLSDEYDYTKNDYKSKNTEITKTIQKSLDFKDKAIGRCKRENAIYGLEYSSLICDIALGGICAILGLLHYLEIGKSIEKKTGLIGIAAGTIGFIITLIYVIFSGYIFTNDIPSSDTRDLGSENWDGKKLFQNKAYLKWNGFKYVPPYDLEKYNDDEDIAFAKYNELGQKQYNYDPDILKVYEEYRDCKRDNFDENTPREGNCDYIWSTNTENEKIYFKYIYDRWTTTIILSVFIFVLNIGLILFGFFLFKNFGESSPGSVPIPMSSVNAEENK